MDAEARFAAALSSPALVDAKARDRWLALFDAHGVVEDPVEAGRYTGAHEIARFWDAFIGPQPSVRFEVERDYFAGDTLVRKATVVSITEADPLELLRVPALIEYTLRDGRLASLRAVWDPRHVVAWFLRRGWSGARALARHSSRMTATVGLHNALRFSGTLLGGLAIDRARTLIDALRSGEHDEWAQRLRHAKIRVACDDREPTGDAIAALARVQDRVGPLAAMAVERVVTCGHHVAACFGDVHGGAGLALVLRADDRGRVDELTLVPATVARVLRAV